MDEFLECFLRKHLFQRNSLVLKLMIFCRGKLCQNQKQPFKGDLRKRFSENMQQSYRRTPMTKCDFNKVAKKKWSDTL